MMRILAVTMLVLNALVLQAQITSSSSNAAKDPSFIYNTVIHYDGKMKESKRKSVYDLQVNMGSTGFPVGKSRLVKVKTGELIWEGEYFILNRVEPTKSKYQNKATWFYPGGQKMRESEYAGGLLQGKTRLYNERGRLTHEGNFINGELTQEWTYYDEAGNEGLAYLQRFDMLYSGWTIEEGGGKSFVDEGVLVVQSNSENGFAVREEVPFSTEGDFSIEIDFKLLAKEGWIMYGQSDSANYYGIVLTDKGELRLDHVVDAKDAQAPQVFKYAPSKGKNRLRIYKRDEDVFISVNESMITSYKHQPFHGYQMGFFLPGKGEMEIFSIAVLEFTNTKGKAGKGKNDRTMLADPETGWSPAASGFFVTSGGYFVTSYRALEHAKSIGIQQMYKGKKIVLNAKVVATDPRNDIAILLVDDLRYVQPGVIPFKFNNTPAEPGEAIYTLGYSLSGPLDEIAIQDGVISTSSGRGGDDRVYGVSIPVTVGNNGGPVLDKTGNLIGLNSSSFSKEGNHVVKGSAIMNLLQSLQNPPKLSTTSLLKNKPLKDQVKVMRSFVTMVCIK